VKKEKIVGKSEFSADFFELKELIDIKPEEGVLY